MVGAKTGVGATATEVVAVTTGVVAAATGVIVATAAATMRMLNLVKVMM